jgi:hypothetical protein
MKEIKLTQGLRTIVDDWWYNYLNQFKWYANVVRHNRNQYYADRTVIYEGKQVHIPMHRLIMSTPDNLFVDHINGLKWDNREDNLRNCTSSQNLQNMRSLDNCKGVSYNKSRNMFNVSCRLKGKAYFCGSYETLIEAAIAYNSSALKLFGKFAKLNNIETLVESIKHRTTS